MDTVKYTRSIPGCSLTRLYGTAVNMGIYRFHEVLSFREDPFGGVVTVEKTEVGTIDESKSDRHFIPSLEYAVSLVLLDWQYQGVRYIRRELGNVKLVPHVLLDKTGLVHSMANHQCPNLRDTVRRLLRSGVRLPVMSRHDVCTGGVQ